jgi:hypothetical protein
MYNKLPDNSKQLKTEFNFIISKDIYDKEKTYIFNNKFLGINVEICTLNTFPKDYGILSKQYLNEMFF